MSQSPVFPKAIGATRHLRRFVVAALLSSTSLAPSPATAQSRSVAVSPDQASAPAIGRRINMGVGKSLIADLPRDASEIFVGDPKIANAIVRSARKIYIIGVAAGQTSIYAMDAQGRQIASFDISIGRDVGELDRILKAAMPGNGIVTRTINDTIILTGFVETAADAQMAVDIAKGFVGSTDAGAAGGGGAGPSSNGRVINSLTIRGRDQVTLKVTIAEVRRSILKQLGVTGAIARGNWGSVSVANAFPINSPISQNTFANAGNYAGLAANPALAGLGAQIQAYESNGVARVLAEPSVTAVSGESAKFTVGGQIPIPSYSGCSSGTLCSPSAAFKTYGVTLNFTPVVLAEGRILLRLATEVAEIDPTISVNIGGSNVPGFRTRQNETSMELPSGGSMVSAGLIETLSQSAINGLPGLMNLPILGTLFRSRDYQRQETELLIVVTPYIVKSTRPADIALPTDGFADPSDPQATLLGRVNRIYSTTSNPQIIDGFKGRVGFITD